MKRALIAICLLIPSVAFGQLRPDARTMTCARAAAIVQARGEVVLTTGTYTYDRYVSGGQHCFHGQTTTPAWIGTADSPQCFVGYLCRDPAKLFGR